MPKRTDLKKLMIIGSGPIVIGQAAEFDFSGTQACRSLREEGYQVVLVNSNPATIQTDIETADVTYVEPLTAEMLTRIIEKERPQGILSGMGGQTALNLCSELAELGVLKKYNVELLGSSSKTIAASEDRDLFRQLMHDIKEPTPRSVACHTLEEVLSVIDQVGGYPVIIRAAYTLGGTGSGIAENKEQLEEIVTLGLSYSRIKQVLVEECVLGWAEYEYEVMRDKNDNCIIICNMENLDPMGVHTGESIVIAPSQTLSDRDHQMFRNASLKIIRALGIEGGCNVQFALNSANGQYRVIEVNPRVSRSSALASKATGYPIARVAAKIAVGLALDEIPNSVTGKTFASFEPALDYVVMKIPRWPFDKFRTVDRRIGTQMKSTGEVMAIGRTVEESIMKAVRSLETDRIAIEPEAWSKSTLLSELVEPTDKRLFAIVEALRRGYQPTTLADITKWDIFFINKLHNIVKAEQELKLRGFGKLDKEFFYHLKQMGFSDEYIGYVLGMDEPKITAHRQALGINVSYKMVDTCAAEFEAKTPYFYSTYESQLTSQPVSQSASQTDRPADRQTGQPTKVLILGGGPIRIGQGIEFDYCCVHGVMALREQGIKAIIINNNPETVSTDYDISDRLYFEPLTFEDVMNVIELENPDGVVVQFGGQTSVNLAMPLQAELSRRKDLKTKIFGTPADSIDMAEDRRRFEALMRKMGVIQPEGHTGYSFDEVRELAGKIGYPVLVRPSYVLGGRGMEIVHNEKDLEFYITSAARISKKHPVLVDKYISNAVEIDVDALSDGTDVFIGAIMEHIEEAGVHSGDAGCVIPTQTLKPEIIAEIKRITREVTLALKTIGLINIQLAVKDNKVYMIEANPRASRTVPYVSKTIGVPMAKIATKLMLGATLKQLGLIEMVQVDYVSVKAPVFPFMKLPGVDAILGPEMKSTGEVMGIDKSFGLAYYKALLAAGNSLPTEGQVYITVCDSDKEKIAPIARKLTENGLTIIATKGTAQYLVNNKVPVTTVWRISERQTPNALSLMREGKVKLIINTPTEGSGPKRDGYRMRRLAVELGIPFITTITAARAAANAIELVRKGQMQVFSLNEYLGNSKHRNLKPQMHTDTHEPEGTAHSESTYR
ncbi:MAG: carbamoyl-phosphate synthase large subunit [Planctomycetes bacterium]|nr:carbamoyl-phosphate synthase large subunit [Planctomycetota bacterium]